MWFDADHFSTEVKGIKGFSVRPWQKGNRKRVYVNGYRSSRSGGIAGSQKYPTSGYYDGKEWHWFGADYVPKEVVEELKNEAKAMFEQTFKASKKAL